MVCTRASPALAALLAALLVAPLVAPALLPAAAARSPRARRQLADDDALHPLEEASSAGDEQAREKRKLEGVTEAKFGIKNAVLGFVFGSHSGTTWGAPTPTATATDRARDNSAPSWSRRGARQADIPTFDRNKVSLDFPGSLFGPSVSLLIRTTKIVGDVIQNSAERYQSFLRLFRPLFKGPFEIKGLDPPTTTTEAPTTTEGPPARDNEVRRRRRHGPL